MARYNFRKPFKTAKSEEKTFRNLQILKQAQETCKEELGSKYGEKIIPFVQIIQTVMKTRQIDKFTAMKYIKDHLDIYKKAHAPVFFSAALMEITESDHFVGFEK